jgi:hypothetical protein
MMTASNRALHPTLWPRPARAGLAALLVAVVTVSFTAPAEAQWRWRDASGRVTVSDRPPPKEIPEKDILSRPSSAMQRRAPAATADGGAASAPAVGAASAPPGAASAPALASSAPGGLQAEVEARRKRAEQEQAARAKAEEEKVAAQRAENCRRARAHVATLETGQRIARVNERGEREILDDKARADEMRAARAVMASDCR